jgi:hypothetical protein
MSRDVEDVVGLDTYFANEWALLAARVVYLRGWRRAGHGNFGEPKFFAVGARPVQGTG